MVVTNNLKKTEKVKSLKNTLNFDGGRGGGGSRSCFTENKLVLSQFTGNKISISRFMKEKPNF